ncbi:hypothetical protein BCR32DRAFT_286817 [Anaeromyces robustus]|uniref:AAA-ATPase-like domain-containing protein n=1 Tax=Anaeromyces robustus TaxID=1754192 RepID=A0A1Y1VU73_9FUNG|nr:hypothetical protein BCR32DRAFT_286817 [Anaeromyces robustus]|eukprot:ORX64841.1 hypothetical protein BCR32DRAFT_286817 [Anaeromyces robustus]
MGVIIDSEDMYKKFKDLLNQEFFVDKSNIINDFNKLIGKDGSNNVCITKPRRFGKTSIAAMLTTYYSVGIDSQEIFDKLKVSKGKSSDETKKKKEIELYRKFQGKYHTLYFDFSSELYKYNSLNALLDSINDILKDDIKYIYPNINVLNNAKNDNLIYNLRILHRKTKDFIIIIIIIDEWDSVIFSNRFTPDDKVKYIRFLKSLIKDKSYSAFVFMTGIMPIEKSILNCFVEYSMLNDEEYYQYFGFTEQEVRDLCEKNKKINKNNKIEYKDLENWYNGYKAYNGEKIFNPWSVYHALDNDRIDNYWNGTGGFDELVNIINFNILGVKDEILELIKGNKIEIEIEGFGTENILNRLTNKEETNEKANEKKLKAELYSKMVTFGFLTYYDGKISIPNKELEENFIEVLKSNKDMKYYYDIINNSKIEEYDNELNLIPINEYPPNSEKKRKIDQKSDESPIEHCDDIYKYFAIIEYSYFNTLNYECSSNKCYKGKCSSYLIVPDESTNFTKSIETAICLVEIIFLITVLIFTNIIYKSIFNPKDCDVKGYMNINSEQCYLTNKK